MAGNLRNLAAAACVAAVCLAATDSASSATKGVLDVAPADAAMVAVAHKPSDFFDRALRVIAIFEESAKDQTIQQRLEVLTGLSEGIDVAKDFGVIILDADSEAVWAFTVDDADAWKKAYSPQKTEGGINKLDVDGNEQFSATIEGMTLVSTHENSLKRCLASERALSGALSPGGLIAAGRGDVYVHINMAPLREQLLAGVLELSETLKQSTMEFPGATGLDEAGLAVVECFLSGLQTIIAEAETVDLAARIEPEYLRLLHVHGFKPDGKVAGHLSAVKHAGRDILRGLPDMPFLVAFAGEFEAVDPERPGLMETMVRQMMELAPIKEQLSEEDRTALDRATKQLYRNLTGFNALVNFGVPGPGMSFAGHYLVTDAKAARHAMEGMMKFASAKVAVLGMQAGMEKLPEPVKIGGVDVDVYKYEITTTAPAQDNPLVMMQQQMMKKIYGQNPRFYLAPRSKHALAMSFADDQVARQQMEALFAGKNKLRDAKHVAETLGQLPNAADIVVLVDPARCVTAIQGMMMSIMGGQAPPEMATPTVAPLGWACCLDKSRVRGELVLPIKTIEVLADLLRALAAPATAPATAEAESSGERGGE